MPYPLPFNPRFQGRIIKRIAVFFLALLLIGCGASSDSADSGGSGLTYSGLRSQAFIDSTNAAALAVGSLRGCQSAASLPSPSVSRAAGSAPQTEGIRPLVLNLAGSLRTAMARITFAGATGLDVQYQRSAQNASGQAPGDCGGTGDCALTYDESSGALSGTLHFNAYCSNGITLDGPSSFSGVYDGRTDQFDWFTVIFSNLVMTADGQAFAMDGELDCDFSGIETTLTIDMLVRNSANDVFWINNYTIQVNGNAFMLAGRFYDPNFGYVDFATETALIINSGDPYPGSGVMVFKGSAGLSGGPTEARLEALSATTCRVQADTDGDGTYDHDTGILVWSDF